MSAVEVLAPEVMPAPATAVIKVQSAPAMINVNFAQVRESLANQLAKYDLVVTADTLADAKKLATELNKYATEFDKCRKAAVEQVSGPIKEFEAQMKELIAMCKDGRQKLIDQTQRFEEETLATIRDLLGETLGREWDAHSVSAEFRKSNIKDLVLLGSITSTGKLTAKVVNELKARATDDKAAENRIKMRLMELENASYRAGLKAPLTRAHVEVFLFAADDEYSQRLQAMMTSEIQRQEQAEAAMRQQMELEQERNRQAQEAAEQRVREANERARQAELAAQEAAERAQQAAAQAQQPAPVEQAPQAAQQAAAPQAAATKVYYAPMGEKRVSLNTPDFEQSAQAAINAQQTDGLQYGIYTKADGLVGIVHGGRVYWRA